MSASFLLGDILIEVEFRGVKTLRLTVYPPGGRVKISAPPGTAPETIRNFAVSKKDFIEKHRERFRSHSKAGGPPRNNSTVYVWGIPHRLEFVERKGNHKIVIENGIMKLYAPPDSTESKRGAFLDRWYSRVLKESAPGIIKKWEPLIGVTIHKLYVRKMKKYWGSCNYEKQTMRLNSELVKRNPECLEYVIVHEMVHIIERSHNRNFYRILGSYIPAWKTIRKKMNSGEL